LAMYLQGVNNVFDLVWTLGLTYRDVYHQNELEQSAYNFEHSNIEFLLSAFAARGAISVTERAAYIGRIRNLARSVAQSYLDSRARLGFPTAARAWAEET